MQIHHFAWRKYENCGEDMNSTVLPEDSKLKRELHAWLHATCLLRKCIFPFPRKCEISNKFASLCFCETAKVTFSIILVKRNNVSSSKHFHKIGPFVSHVDDNKSCLFCKKLKKKSTFLNFRQDLRENFSSFLYISQASFVKRRKLLWRNCEKEIFF